MADLMSLVWAGDENFTSEPLQLVCGHVETCGRSLALQVGKGQVGGH